MSSKKSHGISILIFLLIIGMGIGAFRLYKWHENEKVKVKENIEADFYKPVMLNDSTMHMNITESSCIMVQLYNDTVHIDSHNALGVCHNPKSHNIIVVSPEHIVKEINVDSIFKNASSKYFLTKF